MRAHSGNWRRHFSAPHGLPTSIADLVRMPNGGLRVASLNGGMARLRKGGWTEPAIDCPLRGIQVNDLACDRKGNLWAATRDGLFLQNPKGAWQRFSPMADKLAPENDLICLVVDDKGTILCGTRKAGVLAFAPAASQWRVLPKGDTGSPDGYVSALLPLSGGKLVVGTYGYGARVLAKPPWSAPRSAKPLPVNPKPPAAPAGMYLGEDRETQGDWMGRYGTAAYVLAAMGRPYNYAGGPRTLDFGCRPRMGDKKRKTDSLRHWVHRLTADDPRSLRCPIAARRRQASWDDAGELYPPTHGGPNLLVDLDVPAGKWQVSLYFVNIDAIDCPAYWRTADRLLFPNRFRDYTVSIRRRAPGGKPTPLLASSRVTDFCGGTYQRFRMQGGTYALRVSRNRSHNTILSAVFLDPDSSPAAPTGPAMEVATKALAAIQGGADPETSGAVETALALAKARQFTSANRILWTASNAWAKRIASQKGDPASAMFRYEAVGLDMFQALHVPSHERFLKYGHNPDALAATFLRPFLLTLKKSEGARDLSAFVDRLRARPELRGVCRLALQQLPLTAHPDVRARVLVAQGQHGKAAELWRAHAPAAFCPADSLARSLHASLRAGDLPTAQKTMQALEALPEDGFREKYVDHAREALTWAKRKQEKPQ